MQSPTRTSPLVSVCIPVYNCERYIRAAIESVLAQTFEDFEIVVVDNASTDDTVRVVQGLNDPRIRLLINPTNLGPCLNWNRSITESRGRYIKMLGADDILYPHCLATQLQAFETGGGETIALACCPRDIIDATGKVLLRSHGWRIKTASLRISGRAAIRQMAKRGRNSIGEPVTAFFRREDAIKVGCFLPSIQSLFPFCLDWDLWCRLLQKGDLHVSHEPLGAFRINAGSHSLNLVGQFARNDRGYIAYLQQHKLADITHVDYWLGAFGAERDALCRRLFYLYVRLARSLT